MADRKVVLITGASSGIGLATALKLLKEGRTVYGGARRVEAMAPIVAAGGHAIALDVTDDESMTAAVSAVLDTEGRIDVLVNNAGYASYGAVEDVPIAEGRRQIEVNLVGLARMTQLVLPAMRARGSGTIVNLSSMGGTIHTPLGAWYHATKHAIEGFSDSLRLETAPFEIDVVIIAPGAINTGFNEILGKQVMKASGSGPYAAMAEGIARAAAPRPRRQPGQGRQRDRQGGRRRAPENPLPCRTILPVAGVSAPCPARPGIRPGCHQSRQLTRISAGAHGGARYPRRMIGHHADGLQFWEQAFRE